MHTIQQLVEKIIEKDHKALEELYDQYYLFVWTFSNPRDFYTSSSSFPSYLLQVAKSKITALQHAG